MGVQPFFPESLRCGVFIDVDAPPKSLLAKLFDRRVEGVAKWSFSQLKKDPQLQSYSLKERIAKFLFKKETEYVPSERELIISNTITEMIKSLNKKTEICNNDMERGLDHENEMRKRANEWKQVDKNLDKLLSSLKGKKLLTTDEMKKNIADIQAARKVFRSTLPGFVNGSRGAKRHIKQLESAWKKVNKMPHGAPGKYERIEELKARAENITKFCSAKAGVAGQHKKVKKKWEANNRKSSTLLSTLRVAHLNEVSQGLNARAVDLPGQFQGCSYSSAHEKKVSQQRVTSDTKDSLAKDIVRTNRVNFKNSEGVVEVLRDSAQNVNFENNDSAAIKELLQQKLGITEKQMGQLDKCFNQTEFKQIISTLNDLTKTQPQEIVNEEFSCIDLVVESPGKLSLKYTKAVSLKPLDEEGIPAPNAEGYYILKRELKLTAPENDGDLQIDLVTDTISSFTSSDDGINIEAVEGFHNNVPLPDNND